MFVSLKYLVVVELQKYMYNSDHEKKINIVKYYTTVVHAILSRTYVIGRIQKMWIVLVHILSGNYSCNMNWLILQVHNTYTWQELQNELI